MVRPRVLLAVVVLLATAGCTGAPAVPASPTPLPPVVAPTLDPVTPTPTPEPTTAPTIWNKPFNDYSPTEGLLLVIFVALCFTALLIWLR